MKPHHPRRMILVSPHGTAVEICGSNPLWKTCVHQKSPLLLLTAALAVVALLGAFWTFPAKLDMLAASVRCALRGFRSWTLCHFLISSCVPLLLSSQSVHPVQRAVCVSPPSAVFGPEVAHSAGDSAHFSSTQSNK